MFRVVVVVRTKNRILLLSRALENIFEQSYQDFVVSLVNDGGDIDAINHLLTGFPREYRDRILVKHNSCSLGMEAASNIAIDACDSEYIAVHDDDDLWDKNFLYETVEYLSNSSNKDFAGVMVRTKILEERIVNDRIIVENSRIFEPNMRRVSLSDFLVINRAVPISFLYRRSIHNTIGKYDETLKAVGDWEFHLRVLSKFDVGFLDGKPLAFWCHRVDAEGEMSNSIFLKHDEHLYFDALVRDRYMRAAIDQSGIGSYLFQAKCFGDVLRLLADQREISNSLLAELANLSKQVNFLEKQLVLRTIFSRIGNRIVALFRNLAN